MQSNKTKSKVITFMVVVYSLFCLVYSVAVHGKAQTSQESTQSAQIETIIKEADALFLKNKYDDAIHARSFPDARPTYGLIGISPYPY